MPRWHEAGASRTTRSWAASRCRWRDWNSWSSRFSVRVHVRILLRSDDVGRASRSRPGTSARRLPRHANVSRPPRVIGFDYLGPHQYLVTFCTRHRAPVFSHSEASELVIAQFQRTATKHRFAYLAYCLMPDHAHALVEGLTPEADLRTFVKSAKESSGRAYSGAISGRSGRRAITSTCFVRTGIRVRSRVTFSRIQSARALSPTLWTIRTLDQIDGRSVG